MARSSGLMRQLDRSAGTAAALVLPALRRRREMPAAPRRIVLIQPTAIGDTLISSACIAAIGRRFPQARLILAHGAGNAAAVRMLAAAVEPVEIGFGRPDRAVRRLRALEADMIVDLCPWPYATALAARLAAPFTAGFCPAGSRRGRLFDHAVPHRTDRHEIANLAAMAAALGAEAGAGMAIRRDPGALPAGLDPHGLVLCHVSAGGARAAEKSWPAAHWRALAAGLVARGRRVGFTGVAADAPKIQAILSGAGLAPARAFALCGALSLPQLAELLAAAELLVSVDTGVLHLSAAVGAPAIGLHGPTCAARWGSVSPLAQGVDAPHRDAGYMHYGWETHPAQAAIMATIAPEAVLAAADRMLAPRREAV